MKSRQQRQHERELKSLQARNRRCPACGSKTELRTRTLADGSEGYQYHCTSCNARSTTVTGAPTNAYTAWVSEYMK